MTIKTNLVRFLMVALLACLPSFAHAAGDLPFPLGKIVELGSPEIWVESEGTFEIHCQKALLDGTPGYIVRASTLEGIVLDQVVVYEHHGVVKASLALETDLEVEFRRSFEITEPVASLLYPGNHYSWLGMRSH